MELTKRLEQYQRIEEYRQRPLIVYATSTRLGVPGFIAGDAVREFVDQIDAVADGTEVDVLIHSAGGDALAAWKLMSMLRERFDQVSVLVPFMAFSAATIFALGADEIVMHPHASLGPIDPQITVNMPAEQPRRFSYEDVGAFLRFLTEEVHISEQEHVATIIEKLFTVVDPLNVGAAKRASELSHEVGERLLRMHMEEPEGQSLAPQIAANLNKSFFSHGDAVSRSRAISLQLKIQERDEALEELLWQAYLAVESYMELRTPFHPLRHYLSDSEAAESLRPLAPLKLPPNAPPEVQQQGWGQAMQAAMQQMGQPTPEVPYSVINVMIESTRLCTEYRTEGQLTAHRAPDGEVKVNFADTVDGFHTTYRQKK